MDGTTWNPAQSMTTAYASICGSGEYLDHSSFLVWLIENPESPLHFPGEISLKDHDLLHVALNQPLTCEGEAYVVGFTMGADDRTRPWHCRVYKLITKYLYPAKYRFTEPHLKIFDTGFSDGQKSKIRNLHKYDFRALEKLSVKDAQAVFSARLSSK
jgi:hypothetical protein